MNLDQALDYARQVGLTDRQVAATIRAEADRIRFTQDNGDVVLTHPELGTEIRVAAEAVAQHELAGWVRPLADPPEETPAEAPTAPAPRKAK